MKYKRLAFGLASLSMALNACGEQAPEVIPGVEAEVIGHYYQGSYYSPGVPPFVFFHPERYYLEVRQCGHKDYKEINNELGCVAIRVNVSKRIYDSHEDGSKITFK